MRKQEKIEREKARLRTEVVAPTEALNQYIESLGSAPAKKAMPLSELLRRPELNYDQVCKISPAPEPLSRQEKETVEIDMKYQGYIDRQNRQAQRIANLENMALPQDLDYTQVSGLSLEARQKLNAVKPATLGQAMRISGVSPADISVLLIYQKAYGKRGS